MLGTVFPGASHAEILKGPGWDVHEAANNVYTFRHGHARTFFIVTPEGVILADPISPAAARDMMGVIRKITDQPIKYVLYSHSHWDHIDGAGIFKKAGATIIGHELIDPKTNKFATPTIVPTDIKFDDRYVLTLGGYTVEMQYHGGNHGEGWVSMRLPGQKLLFVVDIVSPYRLPYGNIFDSKPKGMLRTLKELEQLDYERIIPGHGPPTAPKAAVSAHRQYFEDLYAAARTALEEYDDPDKAAQSITLPKYQDWERYDIFLTSNAARVIKELRTGE